MNFGERLVQYYNKRIASGEIRLAQKELKDDIRLRSIAISLLEWLSVRHRYPRFRPLRIEKNDEVCQDLVYLMTEKGLFLKVFKIDENGIGFADQLTEDERKELCAIADKEFKPKVMTKGE